MKRFLALVGGIVMAVAPVRADYQKGNHSLQANVGLPGYSDEMKINNGDDTLEDCGGTGGFQYLHFIRSSPTLAIGPDIQWSDLSEENDSSLVANSRSHGANHLALYQGVAKLAYPSGRWRPYVLGGLGAFRSSVQGDINQASGVSIQTFDSIRSGFAGTWGVGMDYFPREHWFFGLEFRQAILSRLLHEPTPAGKSLGIQPVRDPASLTSLTFKIGYKFGAS